MSVPTISGRMRAAVTLAALALVAVSCGGSSDSTTPDDEPPDLVATSAPATDPSEPATDPSESVVAPTDSTPEEEPQPSADAQTTAKLLLPGIAETWDTRDTTSFLLAAGLLVNEPLMSFRPDGTFVPTLATDFDQPDPLTYVYTIRDGVLFSNGTPMTAEDVKFSFELHSADDTTSNSARYWTNVESISVLGDNQIEVTLLEPDPEFPYTVSKTGIVSKALYEAEGDQVGTPGVQQIGTGPYTFGAYTPMRSVELTANPDYWGEAPPYTSITFDSAQDDSTRLLALQSGDYDGIFVPPPGLVTQIDALGSYTPSTASDVALWRIGMDITKAPFDDPKVREAISHAINRDAVVQGAFSGLAVVADAMVPEAIAAISDPELVVSTYAGYAEDFEFDLDLAAAALAESSVPDGFTVEVVVPASDQTTSLIAQTIAQDLEKIGIDLEIKSLDDQAHANAIYFEKTSQGLTIDSWNAGSPEPANLPYSVLAPGALGNTAQLDDPAVNEAIATYRALPSGSPDRQAAFLDILDAAHEQNVYVPLAFPDVFAYTDEGLTIVDFTSFWWLTPMIDTVVPT